MALIQYRCKSFWFFFHFSIFIDLAKKDFNDGKSNTINSDVDDEEENPHLLYIVGACVFVAVCLVAGVLCFLLRYCRHSRYKATPQDDLEIDVENLPVNSAYHQVE